MPVLIKLLMGWGLPPGVAKIASYALIVLAVIALLFGLKTCYDHQVVANHDAKIEASQAKADRKADELATEQKQADLNRSSYEAEQLKEAMDHAPKDPAIDDALERRVAFHKCLGLQQRARANGLEPPRCV